MGFIYDYGCCQFCGYTFEDEPAWEIVRCAGCQQDIETVCCEICGRRVVKNSTERTEDNVIVCSECKVTLDEFDVDVDDDLPF